ncbi:MAG TPA: ATP-dependent helicase [Nitrospiraceae bacterium]|nr:ATP-dependent helicase [Nitrospiraceae bacterium]
MLTRTWSTYQERIFDFVENGTGNAIVEAVAGSGKSTTLVECSARAKGSSLLLAFNKSIAEELKARGVNARTFHSLTFMPVTRDRGVRNIEQNKLRKLVNENLEGARAEMYGPFITRLVSLGRQSGIGCLLPDLPEHWLELVDYHELQLDKKGATIEAAVELASELLGWSNKSNLCDFDDLLYFAVRDGIELQKYDFTFVDEAQDTNAIQRALLRKILTPQSRIMAVGDPAQAIYGFRGADSDSMNLIASEFQCTRLPLSVSYRCPTSVVNHARQWVSHILAAPGATEGSVESRGTAWGPSDFNPNDLIICRTTAPIVSLAFRLLRNGRAARIMGREIGQGLTSLIKRMHAETVNELEANLETYRTREKEKARAKGDEAKVEAIDDKVETILCLLHELPETSRTIGELMQTIERLFSAGSAEAVVLSTIHRAKGLEADTVYWLNSDRCPAKWARQDWQKQQEANLCYVATTRAKHSLILIQEEERK